MSSVKSALPISLKLFPSRLLMAGMLACHSLALASLAVTAIPLLIAWALAGFVVASLVVCYACYGNARSRWFIERVYCTAEGWSLRTADGCDRPARLLESYVHPRLLILNFRLGRFARRSLLVLPDSADASEIRRIRVRLLTEKHDAGPTSRPWS